MNQETQWEEMKWKIDRIQEQSHQFLGQLNSQKSQYETLQTQIGNYKARISAQSEVKAILEELQRLEHERAVGSFENLLSALLNDILPEKRRLVLDLKTKQGVPYLDLFIKKSKALQGDDTFEEDQWEDLPLEHALKGAGGAVANILSVGLRLIALIRSGRRRFLVLDESDCFIKPSLVSRFGDVIQQAALDLGIQILMISHHDETHFPNIPHRMLIEKTEDGLQISPSPSSDPIEWDEEQKGFRSIYLQGFQAHKSSFLHLGPGLTLLYGDNDIGKSAIVNALSAVFYGENDDAQIHHEQEGAEVFITMENEKVLHWKRQRKGKPKVSYSLFEKNQIEPIRTWHSAANLPDWLLEITGMGKIDELDVQIGDQKEPLFLLNKPGSMRAKALSIGMDGGYVQKMLSLDKEQVSEARTMIKHGEKEMERLHRDIQILEPIQQIEKKHQELTQTQTLFLQRFSEKEKLQALYQTWTKAYNCAQQLKTIKETHLPNPIDFKLDAQWITLFERWQMAQNRVTGLSQIKDIHIPKKSPDIFGDYAQALRLQKIWQEAQRRIDILKEIQNITLPQLPDLKFQDEWVFLGKKWFKGKEEVQMKKKALEKASHLEMEARKDLESIQKQIKICPTCLRPLEEESQADHLEHEHMNIDNSTDQPLSVSSEKTITRKRRRRIQSNKNERI